MVRIIEQDNYSVALDLARRTFAAQDPAEQARRTGCRLVGEPEPDRLVVEVRYLDLTCRVTHPEGHVSIAGSQEALPDWEQILVLHYLVSTGKVPAPDDPIIFSQVPSGAFYEAAFQRRVKNHFLSLFGRTPELLLPAAERLGGGKHEGVTGDIGVRIPAFPRVDLFFILWKADAEFPADVNLLMSSSIASFLPTEDIAVLGGIAAGKLIRYARNL